MGKVHINYEYWGNTDTYYVKLNGETVYQTKDARDRDMFIAELKGRLAMFEPDATQMDPLELTYTGTYNGWNYWSVDEEQ